MNRQHSFFNKIDHKLSMDKEIQGRLTTFFKHPNFQTFFNLYKTKFLDKGESGCWEDGKLIFQEEMKLQWPLKIYINNEPISTKPKPILKLIKLHCLVSPDN